MTRHIFSAEDRGANHIHRWTPRCSCGWIGQHRPTRDRAKASHRQHADGRQNNDRRLMTPRVPTPRDRLPEALR